VDVIESHPKGLFDKAAMASLKKWRFKPAVHKGINVATWQEQKIVFDAEES
jgi:TonB family protein